MDEELEAAEGMWPVGLDDRARAQLEGFRVSHENEGADDPVERPRRVDPAAERFGECAGGGGGGGAPGDLS